MTIGLDARTMNSYHDAIGAGALGISMAMTVGSGGVTQLSG